MRFPKGFAEEVKNQADIVRIVSDYVALRKRGANYVALCPFHTEKTPSFNVHPVKGIYKCFGCGAGGGLFDFVMQIEGCSFAEAVRIVAEKSGIPIPASQERSAEDRQRLLWINELAARFFEQQFNGPEGERARQYLARRGIRDDAREIFRIGYATAAWDALTNYLKRNGASRSELELGGLICSSQDGKPYDRFRGRVIFPIMDSQSRVIGFGGRALADEEPKYMNSPETPLYVKGKNLFGLAQAKSEIRRLGCAILVEGYFDCVALFQEGFRNVVATLGTALTESQVRLLGRYMEQPRAIVTFDPDLAGQEAALRSIEVLLSAGFQVSILRIPGGLDPDQFVRERGAAQLSSLLASAQSYIEYVVRAALERHDLSSPSGKVEAINYILPHLVRVRDKVERAEYAEQIANRLKVDSRIIREELKRAALARQDHLDPARARSLTELTQAERQLLELLLANPEVRSHIIPNLKEEDYNGLALAGIFAAIIEAEREGLEPDYANLSERLSSEAERATLAELLVSDLQWASADDFDTLMRRASHALSSLRRRRFERRLAAIQIELEEAERLGNTERVLELFREKAEIKKRMLAQPGLDRFAE
jgi:DNA primase